MPTNGLYDGKRAITGRLTTTAHSTIDVLCVLLRVADCVFCLRVALVVGDKCTLKLLPLAFALLLLLLSLWDRDADGMKRAETNVGSRSTSSDFSRRRRSSGETRKRHTHTLVFFFLGCFRRWPSWGLDVCINTLSPLPSFTSSRPQNTRDVLHARRRESSSRRPLWWLSHTRKRRRQKYT